MRKIYYLSTCSTCKKIIAALNGGQGFELQDIKENPISESALEILRQKVGSYEALFSRRAMKYRGMGLHEKTLEESDYKRLILEEYTFLKRPVIYIGEQVFVGNAKKTIEAAKAALETV